MLWRCASTVKGYLYSACYGYILRVSNNFIIYAYINGILNNLRVRKPERGFKTGLYLLQADLIFG